MSDKSELTDQQQQWADQWATWDYPELQERAVRLAEHRHDVAWLWRLAEHSRGASAMAAEGGDLGSVGGSISDALAAVQQVFGKSAEIEVSPELEPMFRTVFAEYLALHEGEPPTRN